MTLGDGKPIALAADAPTELSASLKVTDDDSYRVALADRDGLGEPRRHRVLHPHARGSPARRAHPQAGDRPVGDAARGSGHRGAGRRRLRHRPAGSRVRGARRRGEGRAARHPARQRRSVTGRHTLFLEDLDVQPGDFVSYYVRARDITRGTRPNEARSDIFFLEVKPFEQEFALAQSQGDMPGGGQQRDRRSRRRAEGNRRRDLEARSARAGGEGRASRSRTSARCRGRRPS